MIKNRCSPVSLVLFVAVCAFLICAVNVQAQNTGIPGGCVAEEGNLNKANCTANDVRLTAVVGKPTIFDECHGGTNAGGLCPNGDADCPGGTCANSQQARSATTSASTLPQTATRFLLERKSGTERGRGNVRGSTSGRTLSTWTVMRAGTSSQTAPRTLNLGP